ncbi:MAG: sodium/solute symporter [Verrucomicrobia bacterium]|nr:sodium/solute symporter [Verrucomicrobiota bacterium]
MHWIDTAVFLGFIASVITIGLWKSAGEKTHSEHGASDYFLAGRGLLWWLIGFSLIAANISTEQFVGMSGQAANWLGMAIASYEWMAAITLVVVAFVFLPTFLKSGIYTIPEFLEYRYNVFARSIMAVCTMIILVGVPTASVIFSGAKVISVFFQGTTLFGLDLGNITVACWIIGILAAVYVFAGGLKACAWADLIQGAALIIGGAIVLWLALRYLAAADPVALAATASAPDITAEKLSNASALSRFWALNNAPLPAGKLHMVRPANDPSIPWTALVIGLWIPNFFYWGLNQYITQRTLGSKSLAEGQKGIVFAAFLKLLIPFVVVIPGILAYNLFRDDLRGEAIRKNAAVIAEYEAKADKVFQFNADFAKADTAKAVELARYNAAKLGADASSLLNDPEGLTKFNEQLVAQAKLQSRPVSRALEGYDYDAAFPTILRRLLPQGKAANGLAGFVLAAIFGAVVSSLAAMLNSASTIATMDIYHKFRRRASQYELVSAGRMFTVLFVLIAILIAPQLGSPHFGGIFTFIQEFQGFISPGILAIFLFGLLVHRAPRMVGTVGLILNPILYGAFKWFVPGVKEWAFLDRMALCFGIILVVLTIITLLRPLPKPVELPVNPAMDITASKGAKRFGLVVVGLTIALYAIFW